MKTQHTPGPWAFDSIRPLTISQNNRRVNRRVAMVYDHNGPNGGVEAFANACLIAAAPEMYKALSDFLTPLDEAKFFDCWQYQQGLAALAKARGEGK